MIDELLNPYKGDEPLKQKDIIIEYDKKRSDYADMLKAILSICKKSDAGDFNKKIHINRFDEIKTRDNKPQISEKIYEIVIGFPSQMTWCEEVHSICGLHFCMMGKTAHLFVDETHSDKNDIKVFLKYAGKVDKDFINVTNKRTQGGIGTTAGVLWNVSSGSTFATSFSKVNFEKYIDIPKYLKAIGRVIKHGILWVPRKLGFFRQNDIIKQKYETLIKDFYIHYLPMLLGEVNAK